MNVIDPYRVLQVDPGADSDVIDAAYKRLAKLYHPDVASDPAAQVRMVQLNLARDMLRDPVRRAAVDRARMRAESTAARVAANDGRVGAAWSTGRTDGPPPEPRSAAGPAAPGTAAPAPQTATTGRPAHDWAFPGADPEGDRSASAWGARTPGAAWPSGRSASGHTYDPQTMGTPQAAGSAGPPPGKPHGSLVHFGRYAGWTLGEIARVDPGYLEWLDRMPIGRGHQAEIDVLLRQLGIRTGIGGTSSRHGLSRRR